MKASSPLPNPTLLLFLVILYHYVDDIIVLYFCTVLVAKADKK